MNYFSQVPQEDQFHDQIYQYLQIEVTISTQLVLMEQTET